MQSPSLFGRTVDVAGFLATEPVGSVHTGQTPHATLFQMGKARLLYFPPVGGIVRSARPVLISMPLINTWTIFDLVPGHSVVERLTAAGVPVYLVDWGRPGPEDSHRPLSYYVDDTLRRMFDRARRHAARIQGTDERIELDAVGYCVGGTFLAAHLARHPGQAARLALVATPIDFHASGRLARWADPDAFPLDTVVDCLGNFPAELMKASFAWLKPMGQSAKWVGLWDRIDRDGFPHLWAAVEQWNDDAVDFPGEAYRAYVRSCYFDNALVRGGWVLDDRPVDLSTADIPALVLAASSDHIAPPASCHALADVWGGPVETRTIRGGHVGICIGRELPSALTDWLLADHV